MTKVTLSHLLFFFIIVFSSFSTQAMDPSEYNARDFVTVRIWPSLNHVSLETRNRMPPERHPLGFELRYSSPSYENYVSLFPGEEDETKDRKVNPKLSSSPYVLMLDKAAELEFIAHAGRPQEFNLFLCEDKIDALINEVCKKGIWHSLEPKKGYGIILNNLRWSLDEEKAGSINSFSFIKNLLYVGGIQFLGKIYESCYFSEFRPSIIDPLQEMINQRVQTKGTQQDLLEICEAARKIYREFSIVSRLDVFVSFRPYSVISSLKTEHFQKIYKLGMESADLSDAIFYLNQLDQCYGEPSLKYFKNIFQEENNLSRGFILVGADESSLCLSSSLNTCSSLEASSTQIVGQDLLKADEEKYKEIQLLQQREEEMDKNYPDLVSHLQSADLKEIYEYRRNPAYVQKLLDKWNEEYTYYISFFGLFSPSTWRQYRAEKWKKN